MAKYLCKKEVRGPEGTLLCVQGKVYDLFESEDGVSAVCEDSAPHLLPPSQRRISRLLPLISL